VDLHPIRFNPERHNFDLGQIRASQQSASEEDKTSAMDLFPDGVLEHYPNVRSVSHA
jgi:hypothetical protein